MSSLDALCESLLAPISGAAPAGADCRHEPEHEAVREEIARMTSLDLKQPDWTRLTQQAQQLLRTKSKDIVIASYLGGAWIAQDGLTGVCRALALLAGILERFPTDAQPVRPRARANAVEWLVERIESFFRTYADSPEPEAVALLGSMVERTDGALSHALGEGAPSLASVRRAFQRLQIDMKQPDPTTVAAPQDAHITAAPAPSVSTASPPPEPPKDVLPATASPITQAPSSLDPRLAAWLAPISPSAPAGADATYSDDFVLLQGEVSKLDALTGKPPDWAKVHDLANRVLESQSKDLLVAAYLAGALLEREGLPGLTLGLWTLAGLLEHHWETLFPPLKRLRRRVNAVGWLADRATLSLASVPAQAPESIEAARLAYEGLVAQLARFGEDAPNVRPLRDAIARLTPVATPAPQPASPRAPTHSTESVAPPESAQPVQVSLSASPPEAPSPTVTIAAPAAPQAADDVSSYLRDVQQGLAKAAAALRDANDADPTSYRLARWAAWLFVDGTPRADAQGRTKIPPPHPRLTDPLATLLKDQRWPALLSKAEAMLAQAPFWFEANLYSHRALAELGGAHADAALVVERETRALLGRVPELRQLRFADGTPMLGPEAAARFAAVEARGSTLSGAAAHSLSAEVRAQVVRGGQPALEAAQAEIAAATSGRARFLLRLDLARACREGAQSKLALALLRALDRELVRHGLQVWEPALAVEVLRELLDALRIQAGTVGVVTTELDEVCARLADLAPAAVG